MAGRTESQAFKKTHQVVGADHGVSGNINDALFKTRGGGTEDLTSPPDNEGPTNSAIEQDLRTKGYTTRTEDVSVEEESDIKQWLDKKAGQ